MRPATAAKTLRPPVQGYEVNRVERLLRRLALSDERSLRSVLGGSAAELPGSGDLDAKAQALVTLGALLSVGAGAVSLRWAVEHANAAGATEDEVLGVLLAIAPAVGHARVVGVAPQLALALGYDLEEADRR
jgi:alkylhydroperoxidase/carboxymuconolactone decarboxylase family protein YurZ